VEPAAEIRPGMERISAMFDVELADIKVFARPFYILKPFLYLEALFILKSLGRDRASFAQRL
jgi:hypothetical protein